MNLRKKPPLSQRMLNYAEVAAWDQRRRRELGFFAGLRWFERVQDGRLLLISRHWPHRLCWSWFADISRIKTELGYCRKFAFSISRVAHQARLSLWSHEIAFHWQRSSWWMPNVGPEKQRAPVAVWRRQFTHPDLPFTAGK